ncbi:6-phosphogluconolactonase [Gammaproteobacteria bacterium]|nr:6-phosphogluconolactonase [Gammaproteobacteria bacterium]MDA9248005.1 6-phosphogluconolactonase [Gammaproteobacteria bacterium]
MHKNSLYIHSLLSKAIKNKGFASFIVSGGSSPINIFQDLNKSDLDWANIEVSLVDDRSVDMHHDDSNEKLLNEKLLVNNASAASFVSLKSEPSRVYKINQPYDLMLLGMGEDAHFASLFPSMIKSNIEYFKIDSMPEIIYTQPMGNPLHERISMNLAMILNSKSIILLVSNSKKSDLVTEARINKDLPLYYLLNQKIVDVKILKTY